MCGGCRGVPAPLEGQMPSIPPQPWCPCQDPSVNNCSRSKPSRCGRLQEDLLCGVYQGGSRDRFVGGRDGLGSTSAPPSRPLMEVLGLGGHHWFLSGSQHSKQVPHHTRRTFHLLTSMAALPNQPMGPSAILLLKALRPEACLRDRAGTWLAAGGL